jgi:hypothetical protein
MTPQEQDEILSPLNDSVVLSILSIMTDYLKLTNQVSKLESQGFFTAPYWWRRGVFDRRISQRKSDLEYASQRDPRNYAEALRRMKQP